MNDFRPCPYCKKQNARHLKRCSWCYSHLPTKGQRTFQVLVFWASLAGIIAAAYAAYRVGGL